jgi:hypothetical protein
VLYPRAPTLRFLKRRGKQESFRDDRSKTIGQLFCKAHVRCATLDFAEIAWAHLIPLRTLFARGNIGLGRRAAVQVTEEWSQP